MRLSENISLKTYNTFGIDVIARYFSSFDSTESLIELLEFAASKEVKHKLILGGGSNLLFTENVDGIVLHNCIGGIELLSEDVASVRVKVGAGENWHRFVLYCVENGWAGIENLSLIPGNVGASPMQNIGAYGVEVQEVIEEVEVWSLDEQKKMRFSKKDCAFGYRESIFKRALKGRVVILSVVFRLFKIPTFRTEYGAIQQELDKMNLEKLTIKAVSDAVIRIRSSKLPDPAVIGNAGSFFKNPTVSAATYHQLKTAFPGLVAYELADGHYKLAAGWLIEQCGWKGYRKGDAGCHAQQALVLVNYGNAKGKEIVELSGAIADSIHRRFGVLLEREVNLFPPMD